VPPSDLAFGLECVQAELQARLSADEYAIVGPIVESGLLRVTPVPPSEPAPIGAEGLDPSARRYLEALLNRNWNGARAVVHEALERDIPLQDLYLHLFAWAQHEVGRLWQVGKISVAEEHLCTAATQRIMAELYPKVFGATRTERSVVVACITSELHEVGARMVADFFEMEGWDTCYLGANMPAGDMARLIASKPPDVLALSCTFTPHLSRMTDLITTVRAAVPHRRLKVIVGGYPFKVDPELWRFVGADGMARDGADAPVRAAQMLAEA